MAKKALVVVNADWFFLSHRLPLGVALRDAGWDVTVVAGDTGQTDRIRAAGLRYLPIAVDRGGRSITRDARLFADLVRLYRRERPDIVHHVTIKPVLYGSLAATALGIPTINALSGLGYVFTERAGDGPKQRALREAVRLAYRAALANPRSRCIFQNPDDRAAFVDGGLVPRERTVIIPGSGVDTTHFAPTPLPPGVPLIVVPGRVLRDKGIVELVEAARIVRSRGVEARFALVGPLDLHNPAHLTEAEVSAWVKEGIVEWWGNRTDMPDVLAQSTLVVLPSYREGRPLALIEAAACGRACVTTDVPGCREVVRHGDNGWLVPAKRAPELADAIAAALGDRVELERRGRRGREIVLAEMSLDVVLGATLAVYEELTLSGGDVGSRRR
jgi:glycosyltransferase involved in cell wall biosynthesis